MANKREPQFGFKIDPQLREDFREVAKSKGFLMSVYLRQLMMQEVKKYKEEQK